MHLFKIVAAVWIVGTVSAWGGYVMGQRSVGAKECNLAPMVAKMDEVQEQIIGIAAQKCFTVNTPVMNIDVFSVPNVGVHRVPKPKKQPEKQVNVAEAPKPAEEPKPEEGKP